jgi:hypothetical protein
MPGHPRLSVAEFLETWMPGIKPDMTPNYFNILLTKP